MGDTLSSVRVGGDTYTIRPFKGFKALRIGRVVASITRQVPEVLDEVAKFTRQYESNNSIRITRAMAATMPVWQAATENVSEEVWTAADGVLEIPQSPSFNEQVMAVFPIVFERAEREVTQLLAWVAVSDAELRRADEEGGDEAVAELVSRLARNLLHEGDIEELIALAGAGADVIAEQFAAGGEAMGKLRGWLGQNEPTPPTTERSKTRKQNSSTASRRPTAGREAKPSTATGGGS